MRSLTMAIVVLSAQLLNSVSSGAEFDWRFPSDKITVQQWEEFRVEVLAKPRLERQEFANQLVLISMEERRVYVFTQPLHPAHPAVVIRAVVPAETGSSVQRMGHYAGDAVAFDKWWHEFDALDARVPGQVR